MQDHWDRMRSYAFPFFRISPKLPCQHHLLVHRNTNGRQGDEVEGHIDAKSEDNGRSNDTWHVQTMHIATS